MTTCIAFLRGVNVGRAKRVAMAELRAMVESLDNANVRTLLNSGNVVFETRRPNVTKLSRSIEAAIQARFGFSASVVVVTAAHITAIVRENPLPRAADQPSKYLVAFVPGGTALAKVRPLLAQSWAPEAVAVGKHAAYLWCNDGIIESKLLKAFERLTEGAATTRNWTTVLKLRAAVASVAG
jgi:uncharacterized protein (DUF1697 family)